MPVVRPKFAPALLFSFALSTFALSAQQPQEDKSAAPTAEIIMQRVAANQDRSEAERVHYIYVQHARVLSRKGKTVMCEEVTDARITPTSDGSQQQLLKLQGRVLQKGKYTAYTSLPDDKGKVKGSSDNDPITIDIGGTDTDLVENMRSNMINGKSKDGIASDLFPLTSKSQADYSFKLIGRQQMNGRDTFHIEFRPKDKNDLGWKGDAFIDTDAYQPVAVSTTMARNLPIGVRILLGTSLPGLGFTVVYAPQPASGSGPNSHADAVWFPISFSTEFKLHVLFFFNREIVIDAQNRDFEKTHVDSKLIYEPDTKKTE
jgi:hypothetical protein